MPPDFFPGLPRSRVGTLQRPLGARFARSSCRESVVKRKIHSSYSTRRRRRATAVTISVVITAAVITVSRRRKTAAAVAGWAREVGPVPVVPAAPSTRTVINGSPVTPANRALAWIGGGAATGPRPAVARCQRQPKSFALVMGDSCQ